MKKLALTSLIAMFAFTGAHAANVIDGNPLYMPKAGHFYSVTDLSTHTEGTPYTLKENFGYGITDKLAVEVKTSLSENDAFDVYGWDDMTFAAAFRALDKGAWKLDVIGAYTVNDMYNYPQPKPFDSWFDKGLTNYAWTLGVRGGYVASNWTVAGHAYLNYWNDESFNWNEDKGARGVHTVDLGLDGQFVLNNQFNLVAGVEYTGVLDKEYRGTPGAKIENRGTIDTMFGVNFNIDSTKYVGAYVNGSLNHRGGDNADEWEWDTGYGMGVKFGIDF